MLQHRCDIYAETQNVGPGDFWLPTLQLVNGVVFVHNVSHLELDLLARMFNNT